MCSKLVENSNYEKTSRILSCPQLCNLWPSLLIYFIHNLPYQQFTAHPPSDQENKKLLESLKFLLNKSFYNQYENNESLLMNVNICLNNALNIVKWILDYRHKNVSSVDSNFNVNSILGGLQDNCVLTVIKQSIDIHSCSSLELEHLLKDHEIWIFKSYLSMKILLKAILNNHHSNARLVISMANDNQYTEIESFLNAINPLSLRIEVIENVFSMLFIRHESHFHSIEETSEEEEFNTIVKERNNSIYENCDSEINKRSGFICNKDIVEKILELLKRCVVQLGID